MFAPSMPTIPPALFLRPRRVALTPGTAGEPAGLYAYARDALFAGLPAVGLKEGDAVLAPAYTCESVLAPMVRRGLRILYYGLEEDLSPNLEDLRRGWSSAKALYLIDYFGVATPPAGLIEEARGRGLVVIRDMAHCFYANPVAAPPEASMAIWSLRKFYPVPDGGVLSLSVDHPPGARPGSRGALCLGTTGRLVVKHLAGRAGVRVGRGVRPAGDSRGALQGENWNLTGRAISPTSLFLLGRCDPSSILEGRRRNFNSLARRLSRCGPGVRPLFDRLPDGACPYAFPLLVERRDLLLNALQSQGVMPEATFRNCPYLPPGAVEIRPGVLDEATVLADRVLSLPVLPEIPSRLIERMADLVEEWRP